MSQTLDVPNPYKHGPLFHLTPYRLFGAGPSNPSPGVVHSLLLPQITPFNKKYFDLAKEISTMTKYVFQTKNPMTFIAQLPGTGGNEAMMTNLADPGDTVLVTIGGIWGVKFANMGRRYDLNVVEIPIAYGEVYTVEAIEEQIIKHKPVAIFVTHGESSAGTLQPMQGLGEMCHKHDCLLAVDAVISTCIVPIFTDRWQIDAINAAAQKGIGGFPGIVLMSFSPRAHERMLKKKHPPPYILDMLSHSKVWRCFGDKSASYIYTFNSGTLAATRQALEEICQEGLESIWKRHQRCGEMFVEKVEKLGMRHLVEKRENRFCAVSCLSLPEGVEMQELLEYVLTTHEIELGLGVGPTSGKGIRIGFLGQHAKPDLVNMVVDALEDGIKYCRSSNKAPLASKSFMFYDL